jgi:hypothetical protein
LTNMATTGNSCFKGELKKLDTCVYLLQMQFFSILMHISVIQFRYLYIEITAFWIQIQSNLY